MPAAHHPRSRLVALVATLLAGACGQSTPAPPRATGSEAVTSVGVTAIVAGATSSVPARRLDDGVLDIAWIGGSEVELRDTSLPVELAAALPTVAGDPVAVHGYTRIAPMPDDVGASVTEAVADGADVLLISINIAWLTWEFPHCNPPEGTPVDPVERYACVLTPISAEVTERNRVAIADLVATVVATGLPAYLYLLPHSTSALADPRIAGLITTREAELAAFDPGVPTVAFEAASFTRDRAGFDQPEQFVDMVHPTPAGARAIADHLAGELVRWLTP